MDSLRQHLYTVPVPSTAFEAGGAYLLLGVIRYTYSREAVHYRSGIKFRRIKATRSYSENASKPWHIESAYDTLVEIENSAWIAELQSDTVDMQLRLGKKWDLHHYVIYLDSFGTLEVAAESWEALPEEVGSWPNPTTI